MRYYIFSMSLKIYLLDCRNIPLDVLLNSSYISLKEKLSFEKYQNETVKKEKIASSILKNKYIGEYHIDESGKPISETEFFNVSHSSEVVVLVEDVVPIGIDIEKIRPVEDDLVNYATNESERSYVKDEKAFFEIWTNKEALVKALGTGIKTKPSLIPGLPVNGLISYQDKFYSNKTVNYEDFVLTVSRQGKEDYQIEIIKEVI